MTEDKMVGWHHLLDMSLSQLLEMLKDREAWGSAAHGVTKRMTEQQEARQEIQGGLYRGPCRSKWEQKKCNRFLFWGRVSPPETGALFGVRARCVQGSGQKSGLGVFCPPLYGIVCRGLLCLLSSQHPIFAAATQEGTVGFFGPFISFGPEFAPTTHTHTHTHTHTQSYLTLMASFFSCISQG